MLFQLHKVPESYRLEQDAAQINNNEVIFSKYDDYGWDVLTENIQS